MADERPGGRAVLGQSPTASIVGLPPCRLPPTFHAPKRRKRYMERWANRVVGCVCFVGTAEHWKIVLYLFGR